jgi:P27 family predicted phage terminase small subunit
MGRRGPAPQPTALKLLKGETRTSRLNRDAPKPISKLPALPAGMEPRAQEIWHRQVESMASTGVLTPVDTDTLRAYCEAVARYEPAAEMLSKSGPLVKGARSGELVKNPLHQIVRDNVILIRLLARELGFVPAGREGIRPGGLGESEDPFDRWAELEG